MSANTVSHSLLLKEAANHTPALTGPATEYQQECVKHLCLCLHLSPLKPQFAGKSHFALLQ